MNTFILWTIYEIKTDGESVNGGRIRKLGLEKGFNVLVENTSDVENGVRFVVVDDDDAQTISNYSDKWCSYHTLRA